MISYSKNDFQIINVSNNGILNENFIDKFYQFCFDNITEDTTKLFDNYTPKNLDLENHLTFDCLVDKDNTIIGFCGVYNGGRYAEGTYRIGNRMFKNQNYRVNFPILSLTRFLIAEQIERIHNHVDIVFISMHEDNKQKIFHKFLSHININKIVMQNFNNWTIEDNYFHVAPNGNNQNCYQQIVWSSKTNSKIKIPMITLDEYNRLAILPS